MDKKIWDIISNEVIKKEDIDTDIHILMESIERLKTQKLNILFVGATGVGKSSTINAIFNTKVAKVGYSVDPETATIEKFEMDNLILWDTPGLGDNPEKDKIYASQIANALKERDNNGELLIDEIVVLVDGSNRDMKTAYEIIENIVLPYVGDTDRMVVAINQCDMALKGRYWNPDSSLPESELVSFLDEKVISVKSRIRVSAGVTIEPIYYSAYHHYNISKLLSTIIKKMPEQKRFLIADSLNKNPQIWKQNDDLENYNVEIQKEIKGSMAKALDGAAKGAVAGATVGSLIPVVGPVIGAAVGAVLGFLGGVTGE